MVPTLPQGPEIPRGNVAAARDAFLDAVDRLSRGRTCLIQVGAHDGVMSDPVFRIARRRNWHGLLVEPHPRYFARLREVHAGRVAFLLENVAISDREGQLALFHLADDERTAGFPRWVAGCASFDRQRLVRPVTIGCRHVGIDFDETLIARVDVPVLRLETVLARHGLESADLLVIDVEGHELAVMAGADLAALGLAGMLVECNGRNQRQEKDYVAAIRAAGLSVCRLGDDLCGFDAARMPTLGPAFAAAGFGPIGGVERWV